MAARAGRAASTKAPTPRGRDMRAGQGVGWFRAPESGSRPVAVQAEDGVKKTDYWLDGAARRARREPKHRSLSLGTQAPERVEGTPRR